MRRLLPSILGCAALILGAARLGAQVGTDIVLVPVHRAGDSLWLSPTYRRVTARPGYDNQPAFAEGGTALLFTRGHSGQTDIYRYRIDGGAVEPVFETPESEYSARSTPDQRGISVVRVELDSTQRLWYLDEEGRGARPLLPDLAPVGYYAWTREGMVVSFVLGAPTSLHLTDPRDGRDTVLALGVGRSLHSIPGTGQVSFPQQQDEGWIIRSWERGMGVRTVAPGLPGSQDHAWTPDGVLLMGRENTVYRWHEDRGRWIPIGTVEVPGLQGISRMAVSPDGTWLALVLNEDEG